VQFVVDVINAGWWIICR